MTKAYWILGLLITLTGLTIAMALNVGSSNVHWWAQSNSQPLEIVQQILWTLRFPRVLNAYIIGGTLALSGCLLQNLLRNPLADAYILGVSGGACAAVLGAILLGISTIGLNIAAWIGAGFSIGLVYWLTKGPKPRSTQQLLLTGVVVSVGWGAFISFLLTVSPDHQVPGLLFWLMGSLSYGGNAWLSGAVLLIGTLLSLTQAYPLNILTLDTRKAQSLGLDVKRLQTQIYLVSSLLTASAVTVAGNIGFVGLITPHCLRLLGLRDHRVLIPGCVLLGGTFLLIADTLARVVFAPEELPVGVMTAALGVPFFIMLLHLEHGQ